MEKELIPSVTKSQLASMLGISLRTLQRKMAQNEISVPRGLICHDATKEILTKLGYSDLVVKIREGKS